MTDHDARFTHPLGELIRGRVSCRTYRPEPLAEAQRAALQARIDALPAGPFGSRVRLRLLADLELSAEQLAGLGTYGFISGARSFVAGTVAAATAPGGRVVMHAAGSSASSAGRPSAPTPPPTPTPGGQVPSTGTGDEVAHRLLDYGFVFEQLVLDATDLGLGTCWLGGTFRRSAIAAMIDAGPDDLVPAITPIGYAADRRSLRERLIRWGAGADRRKPWSQLFFVAAAPAAAGADAPPGLQPLTPDQAGPWAEPLALLRLAPSASNRQPWRAVLAADHSRLDLFLARTPGYRKLTGVDLQCVDMGIACCHLALAAGASPLASGLPGGWRVTPPAAPVADWEYCLSWWRA